MALGRTIDLKREVAMFMVISFVFASSRGGLGIWKRGGSLLFCQLSVGPVLRLSESQNKVRTTKALDRNRGLHCSMARRRRSTSHRGRNESSSATHKSRRRSQENPPSKTAKIKFRNALSCCAPLLVGFAVWRRTLGGTGVVPVLKHDQAACLEECWVSGIVRRGRYSLVQELHSLQRVKSCPMDVTTAQHHSMGDRASVGCRSNVLPTPIGVDEGSVFVSP